MNVEEFYREDCQDEVCDCVPRRVDRTPCSFAKKELIISPKSKLKTLQLYGYTFPEEPLARQEALDFIEQYPLFILKGGTTLCHSTDIHKILAFKKGEPATVPETLGWWKNYLVGHSKYKGGWFTYETGYGGPEFGMLLHYRVQGDIPILFVPRQKGDELWSGSHLVKGVKDWKKKGYPMIDTKYYADQLAERLVSLGFPGYISCDECEVFLTHESMRKSMNERPYKIVYEPDIPGKSSQTKEQTIFHLMVEALSEANDKYPLKVFEGERGGVTLVNLNETQIQKIMPITDLRKAYMDLGFSVPDIKQVPPPDETKSVIISQDYEIPEIKIPSDTIKLRVQNNNVKIISFWPETLEKIELESESLLEIPPFPSSLLYLRIYEAHIKDFPPFPETVRDIVIEKFGLTTLPSLPKKLEKLTVRERRLEKLPRLPETLLSLVLDGCSGLRELPPLPKKLRFLSLRNVIVDHFILPKDTECSDCQSYMYTRDE